MNHSTLATFSNDFLYSIYEQVPVGIIITNDNGVIEDTNKFLCVTMGYEKSELIGQNVEFLIPERFRHAHIKLRNDYLKQPTNRKMGQNKELYAIAKNGSEVPIQANLTTINENASLKVIITLNDISIKKEDDKKLKALNNELVEISTPILEAWDRIAIIPIIGTLDTERARLLMENTLTQMQKERYLVTILDITGLAAIDTSVAHHLLKLTEAIRLMGGLAIITGVSPEIAKTIVRLGVNLGDLKTSSTLSRGIKYAIASLENN